MLWRRECLCTCGMALLSVRFALHACRYYIATLEGLEHSWLTYVGNRAMRSSLCRM